MHLEQKGNNVGGQLAYFRSIKVFLKWYWEELDLDEKNPIDKVTPPKAKPQIMEGVTKEQVAWLLVV